MLRKKAKRCKAPRRASLKLPLLAAAALCCYLVFCLDRYMAKCVQEYADFECERIVASAVQNAVSAMWEESGFSAEEFYSQEQAANGQTVQIRVDTNRTNAARVLLTQKLNEALDIAVQEEPHVHLSALLGSYLFSQKGPALQMKIYPQHFSRVQLVPSLQSAGINQTRFNITVTFEVNLSTSILNYRSRAESNISVPLIEVLILGNVPSYYAN